MNKTKSIILLVVLALLFTFYLIGENKVASQVNSSALTLSSARFINTDESLPPIKTKNEVFGLSADYTEGDRLKDICDDFKACVEDGELDPWASVYERQVKEYGELATRFLFENEIYWTQTTDIDMDGEEELAIALCGVWGNGCPHKIIIVKNGRIIKSAE